MRKNINKLATLVMTSALAASMSFGAFAVEVPATGATGESTEGQPAQETTQDYSVGEYGKEIQIPKSVTTDINNPTSAPYTAFNLTVGKGSVAKAKQILKTDKVTKDGDAFEVYAGTDEQLATIRVSAADFRNGYDSFANGIYKDHFTVSVPITEFKNAGVYAFTLKEVKGSYSGVIYDESTYDMFVFVENVFKQDGTLDHLQIASVIVANSDGVKIGGGKLTNDTATGIKNNFGYEGTEEDPIPDGDTTHDITIGKKVAGNTANLSDKFTFVVSVKPKTGITVDGTDVDKTVASENQEFTLTYAEPKTVDETTVTSEKIKANGGTHEITIKNGEFAKINGLTDAYEVTVYEVEAGKDGYKTDYDYKNGKNATSVTGSLDKTNEATTDDNVVVTVSADEATLGITNTRENTIPTGVAMDVAPYALMVALAGGAAATFLRKKESFED